MTDRPWFQLWHRDFLASKTYRRLRTHELRWAYMLLLIECWEEGSLPDDEAELQAIADVDDDAWGRLWAAVERKLPVSPDGRRRNAKIDGLLQGIAESHARRVAAGEKGARRRWRDGNATASDSNAIAGPEQAHSMTVASDSTQTHTHTQTQNVVPIGTTGRTSRDSPPAAGGRPHGEGTMIDESTATSPSPGLGHPPPTAGTQDAPNGSDGRSRDEDGEPLAEHLVRVLHNTGVDKSGKVTAASSTGFGRLVRRLAKGGGGTLAASVRVRDAIDGVFADPEPDSSGFCWADVLRSGQSWASKTRDKSRHKFEMVEQHLARKAAGPVRRATVADRNRDVLDRFANTGGTDD